MILKRLHSTLLKEIEQSTIAPELKRWTMNYLSGRQSSVLFRGQNFKLRKIISKLPQPPEEISTIPQMIVRYLRQTMKLIAAVRK